MSANGPANTLLSRKIDGGIVSVCVGLPKYVRDNRREVLTGIFKEAITGPVKVRTLNLDGDEQADLTVHGGVDKAVYTYASEHYDFWKNEMPDVRFDWGAFGENLTTTGLLEDEVCIGDRFQFGSAIVRVTQPRLPCYKLGIRFGRPDIIKRFLKACRSGIYFAVEQEGELAAGDSTRLLSSDGHGVTVREVAGLFAGEKASPERIETILATNLADMTKMFVRGLQYEI